jgi:predicted Holliday junction resolvase-like endonuclease
MLEVILGVVLVLSIGLSVWLHFQMSALKNLQYRESLERVESQEAYENLLFSIEREKEGIASTIDNLQNHVKYLQDENRLKVTQTAVLESEIAQIMTQNEEKSQEIKKQKGRAASAHTTKGQILEKWCPFLEHPDIDPDWEAKNWAFMGQPIDYIVFDWRENKEINMADGKIVMLDVKSGKSQLTTKQRRIRDLIKAGRVEWRTIRLE